MTTLNNVCVFCTLERRAQLRCGFVGASKNREHEDAPEMCKIKEEMSHYPKSQRRTTKGPRHGTAEILLPRAEIYAFPSHRNKYQMFAN